MLQLIRFYRIRILEDDEVVHWCRNNALVVMTRTATNGSVTRYNYGLVATICSFSCITQPQTYIPSFPFPLTKNRDLRGAVHHLFRRTLHCIRPFYWIRKRWVRFLIIIYSEPQVTLKVYRSPALKCNTIFEPTGSMSLSISILRIRTSKVSDHGCVRIELWLWRETPSKYYITIIT